MIKKIICNFFILLTFLIIVSPVKADRTIGLNQQCRTDDGQPMMSGGTTSTCVLTAACLPNPIANASPKFTCQQVNPVIDALGQIVPPAAISTIGFGSFGISRVANVIITLIYTFASLIFVFMILYSALQWIMSGGDKEKVAAAKGRLTYAIIGIVLLALAFVIIRIVGGITGFMFFEGQNAPTPTPFPFVTW